MRLFFAGVIVGLLIALGVAVILSVYDQQEQPAKEIVVKQISGEKIDHSKVTYTGGSIKFNTVAEGKGEIFTEIPIVNVPEARAWLQNNNAVVLELLLMGQRMYGVSYLRRWGNFSAGGGVIVSESSFEGIKIQTQYSFSL